MLKKRITACLALRDGIVVQSIGFRRYLPVGHLPVALEFLSRWGIDEIAVLDISARAQKRGPDFTLLETAARKCFTPLAIGGGIRGIEDMRRLNNLGAEKAVIQTLALEQPHIVREAADIFGSQFVVVSIDAKRVGSEYRAYARSGTIDTGHSPTALGKRAEELGAGEILLNSIDRDGAKQGFDLRLIDAVARAVTIPVVALGGAGRPEHFRAALAKTEASGIGAGNFFHFTEHSPITLKAFLKAKRVPVRQGTYARYDGAGFDKQGRLAKRSERSLEKLRFMYLPDEII